MTLDNLIYLCFSFLTCKMGMIAVMLLSRSLGKGKEMFISTVPGMEWARGK